MNFIKFILLDLILRLYSIRGLCQLELPSRIVDITSGITGQVEIKNLVKPTAAVYLILMRLVSLFV